MVAKIFTFLFMIKTNQIEILLFEIFENLKLKIWMVHDNEQLNVFEISIDQK